MAEPPRRFPPPWHADKISGGYVVRDANGQALAYVAERDQAIEQPAHPAVAHGAAARRRPHGVFVEEGFDDGARPPRPQTRSKRDELL
jgi:hypothetical protein